MKIEMINENQIKCTLNRSDLASHQIRLSELAYGTEKTRDLFQDMMDQAFNEFGFEASDPMMIEAIPVSMDCVVLMITKVDEPEDYDQSFAGLSGMADFVLPDPDDLQEQELDALIDNLSDEHFLEGGILDAPSPHKHSEPAPARVMPSSGEMIFSFDTIDLCLAFSRLARGFSGKSTLYRDPSTGRYVMVLVNSQKSANDFGALCNLAYEYGSKEPSGFARSAYFKEHFETIVPSRALQKLADV